MIKLPTYYESPHKIAGIKNTSSVLLGLSGGADSTSLLYNLVTDGEMNGFRVFAAHVNHNIRLDAYNNEAARDEEFCRELCKELGVQLFVKSVDVPTLAKESGESIESVARDVRYDFFSEIMEENGIDVLVTAHNADDNLETQLFNFCRGSGISGLVGIPKMRKLDADRVVVRPILSATKSEILSFCSENDISFVTDSTNFEIDATRNKIRNIIIPELEKIFPSVRRAASRLSLSAADTQDFIVSEAQKYLNSELVASADKCEFSCDSFSSIHRALQDEAIKLIAKRFDVSLEYTHILSIRSLIDKGQPHSMVDLPCGLFCRVEDGMVTFTKERDEETDLEYEVSFDGNTVKLDNTDFCVTTKKEEIDGYTLYTSAVIKSDKIKRDILSGHAVLRNRRTGDTIKDGGNTKKLKKLLCDKKVPMKIRNSIPLLFIDGEMIYAPMCAISDAAKMHGEEEIQIFIYKKL